MEKKEDKVGFTAVGGLTIRFISGLCSYCVFDRAINVMQHRLQFIAAIMFI
jgi:hypothetical protein